MPLNREWIESIWAAHRSDKYIGWADFEWYAVDHDGSVGFFTTGGSGAVPECIFADIDSYIAALEFLRNMVITGEFTILQSFPRTDDWIGASSRGLYGFDHADAPSMPTEYRLVTIPHRRILAHELPRWLQAWLEPLTFVHLQFHNGIAGALDFATDASRWVD
jgi:hypothetical protein